MSAASAAEEAGVPAADPVEGAAWKSGEQPRLVLVVNQGKFGSGFQDLGDRSGECCVHTLVA